jgi:hypothetical protein
LGVIHAEGRGRPSFWRIGDAATAILVARLYEDLLVRRPDPDRPRP